MIKKAAILKGWAAGILFFLGCSQAGFAESSMTPELVSRFEKLETLITNLQTQLVEQDKKYREEVEGLRRQIEIKGPAEEKSALPAGRQIYLPPSPAAPKWLEGLQMGGDLRLRYEAFEDNEATRDRNRFRYRLRWKITKEISPDLDLGFRLVSGSNSDPTSTNQTLTGDFTYKNIFIDQAYAKYRPSFLNDYVPGLEKTEIAGGKFENPFAGASTGMVWDGDVMPEGAYESFNFSFLDGKLKPFANFGQFILQENATLADAELYGYQSGIRWSVPGIDKEAGAEVTHAVAYYDFSDYGRDSNFLVSGTSLARGNTRIGSSPSLAAGDFDILQVYNEIKFKIHGLPVKLFADYAMNLDDQTTNPVDRNIAYEYGLKLGSTKKKGDWEATWYYAYVEPNAVVGAFSDSDFGDGHADKRGNALKFGYQLTDSLKLAAAMYFANNITGADDETRRFQTDLEWVF